MVFWFCVYVLLRWWSLFMLLALNLQLFITMDSVATVAPDFI